ncbi:SigE family RNA polymerase sigma factor [Streptomyces albus]|uniref:SigE family RNA polymerase sigma factor n=2 Tax=Streptomyces albus TaxID=1888 RepID=A0A6C1CAK3_9ACTN|nr:MULTISPECIES: SigE family RNA polymerase sigma factor [Streptomyces]EPD94702.1 sigma-E family RNA polymerase sigma-70 factor [Streptomyces sp. HPH0547]MDI6413383.1 SigE family RNA polymerase sigma factor [Streptomyces albus]QID37896.1 SigE family RNA polymerase sigma factor [Streptomyces albus]TGG75678.1 SigE family RNA polymerase sigma factor [Streptomyces albus]UVN55135.1 SigE family RNA polymerase sigma factor [Streptomyces albus]
MNTLHGTNTSAVLHTRLHVPSVPAQTWPEKSGVVSGRGCARGTGRMRPRTVFGPAVEGLRGEAPQGETGDRGETGNTGDRGSEGDFRTSGEHREAAALGPVEETGTAEVDADAEAAFTAYVRERRASLYATAYHLTGDRYEAEDLLQSALFSTYRAWGRISDKAAVGGYLRRTMTNLHISAWRRRKLNEYPTEELPETAGEQDAMRGTELRTVLWQALARLPELQRTMLVLRYYEGRTDPEIADILDISVGTVKSSIWRSLRRLRDDEVLSFGRNQEESFDELVA